MSGLENLDNDMEEDLEDNLSSDDLEAVSFVCEDCDYRWEDSAVDDGYEISTVCPMCGSTNVTQL